MDTFTSSVTSQTFTLTSFDAIVSHINCSFVAFYRNDHDDQSRFMPADVMQESFYRALVQFPIMAGDLVQRDDGGLEVTVDQHNLNMPNYCESTADDMHFKDIKATNYSPEFWPKGLENSGIALAINISHAIGDAVCYNALADVWANEMCALEAGRIAAEISFLFDRSIVQKCLPAERTPLDSTTLALYTQPNPEAEAFARLPPHERHALVLDKIGRGTVRQHSLFRFRTKELDDLVQQTKEFVPDGIHLSVSDVLVTVIAKTLAQAHKGIAVASGTDTIERRQGMHKIDFPCNVRPHLGIPGNYTGNMLYQILTYNTIEQAESPTSSQSVAEIAVKIRAGLKAAKAPLISELFDTLEADPTRFTRTMMATNMFQQTVSITNHCKGPVFTSDFGYGKPEFMIMSPPFQMGAICLMLAKPQCKDMYVTLTETPAILKQICANKAWMELTERMY
ncbi:hypothetical protein FBU59_004051 [Linderina macrospora]|uniref:Uncharacterized protein n=1 Tax=Linderina macrospora TaxID=4868 RepID=A0ACC1J6K0_9FUNG|nr:hypothetical protein FBU59_004051 [Linderina macrospora]